MKIAILGYGSQGKSAYKYWNTSGNEVTIHDSRQNIELPENTPSVLGPTFLENLNTYDLIIRAAPIIHPNQIVTANPDTPDILEKVTSNTNEFFRVCPSKNIIGVTGTKGKGTTSTLIAKMLEATGKKVHLGGNIGIPPLELLSDNIKPDDWVVLELANFQLIDIKYSPHIAVCLMVVPEHLDWHEDMEEYIAAKQQLFINQEEHDIAIYYADNENSESVASASMGELIPYMEHPGAFVEDEKIVIGGNEICKVDDIRLLGKHNWQNVCAAITAVWSAVGSNIQPQVLIKPIRSVLTTFVGLPHRIEPVRNINGVTFYNDSFATGLGATYAAIEAIKEPKILILGGYERNLDISELPIRIKDNEVSIKKILVIGQSGERVAKILRESGYTNFEILKDQTIETIVKKAMTISVPGDCVVFSPGFASFDMFNNFEERGNLFKQAVLDL